MKVIHLRVDDDTHAFLLETARKDKRSLSNFLDVLLSDAVEKRRAAKSTPTPAEPEFPQR